MTLPWALAIGEAYRGPRLRRGGGDRIDPGLCRLMAQSGHAEMSAICPLSDQKQTHRYVRFTPESGHRELASICLLCANSGHMQWSAPLGPDSLRLVI